MTAAAALLLAAILAPDPAPDPAIREFRILDAWGRDTVEFRTEAPIEEIVGTSNRVTGVLRADPSNLRGPATSASVRLPVTSFHTGVSARDEAVAKSLGAPKNPDAVFTLDSVTPALGTGLKPNSRSSTPPRSSNRRRQRRQLAIRARLTQYVPGGRPGFKMRPGIRKPVARFDVHLDDFGVARTGSAAPGRGGRARHRERSR
jgi:hypothetical protein